MAFYVLIQHFGPNTGACLGEILAKRTQDARVRVQAGLDRREPRVYVHSLTEDDLSFRCSHILEKVTEDIRRVSLRHDWQPERSQALSGLGVPARGTDGVYTRD